MGLTNFPNGITTFGIPLYGPSNGPDISGKSFFVDANVASSGGNGTSWDEAYQTIAAGLAASHAQISNSNNRHWARRNTVYYCGDSISETLVLAAEKTDLIGVGSDGGSFPRITGNFTIGTAVVSFRIINMGFVPTTTAPVITFPAGMHGWELHGVHLYKVEGVTNTATLQAITSRDWVINNSFLYPDAGGAYNTLGFALTTNTAGIGRSRIFDSLIVGTEGMDIADGGYYEGAIAKGNTIIATNLCIDDDSDSIAFIKNNLITDRKSVV